MDDFSTPNKTNYYGLSPSSSNFIKPLKRPMSSMSPLIVTDDKGDVVLTTGAAGGSRIISAVAQVAATDSFVSLHVQRLCNDRFRHLWKYFTSTKL